MKKTIHFISILFLLLWSSSLLAQLYPVQLVPQLIPPHTNKLIDYTDVSINRIQMQVVTTDITVVNRPVFLKIYIEGNGLKAQSSTLTNGIAPIYINGGDILSLGSVDLAPYFRLRNLEGISQNTYAQTLPDGMYNICFEMYDLVTQKRLSQRSCAMMYLMLNDPPYLNIPSDKEQLNQTDFTNIPFSWTPRQLNASNVSYTFELKELRDPNLEAGYAFDLAPILYAEDNIRTTTLLYDLGMPPLFTGKRYAWRVKATSHNGLAENSVFKNNGYSEVRSFRIAVNCDAPTMLLAQPQGSNAVKIAWIGEANHLKYHIQYRKASVPNAVWFDRYETQSQTVLTNLESGVDYEFRVGGSCEPEAYLQERAYTYSRSQQFSVASREDDSNFSCGLKPNIELLNSEPITNLVVNESFYAGDFEVKILALEGASGVYSGYGSIYVPYLKVTLAVEFKQIQINTAYQLYNGMVETVYDPEWKNVHNVNELNQEEDINIVVDFVIEKIIVDSEGNPVIIGTNGEEQSLDKNKNYTITDKEGNIWKVGSDISAGDNIVKPGGAVAHSGKATPENTNGVNKKGEVEHFTAEGISFVFSNTKDSKYTLDDASFVDQLSQNKITTAYKKVSGVYLPYKAVVRGMEDVIFAKLVNNSGLKIAKDSIDFKTTSGEGIAFTEVDGGYELKLVGGGFDYKIEEVMVVVMQNGKWQVAGAFELVNVKAMELPVHIVPTSTTSLASLNKGVLDDLKKHYSAIGITLKEQITAVYDDRAIDLGEISKDDKSILSKYTKSEQDFINRYVRQNGTEASFYLFVVDAGGAGRELKGRMPLNSQFGFIFEPTAKTIAHELGHGVFGLQHPFTEYNVNQGAVKSIMDYGSPATDFNQMEWKQIHRPNFSFKSIVQKKGDGELISGVYYDPAGYPIQLNVDFAGLVNTTNTEYPNGMLWGWEDNGNWQADIRDGKFYGYKKGDKYHSRTQDSGLINKPLTVISQHYNGNCTTTYFSNEKYVFKTALPSDLVYQNEGRPVLQEALFAKGIAIKTLNVDNCIDETININYSGEYFERVSIPRLKDVPYFKVEELLDEHITDIVSDLNRLIAKNNSGYTYSTSMSKEDLGNIIIDEEVPTESEQLYKIDHRLVYLSEYSRERGTPIDVYVVYKKVDYVLTGGWNEYAKKVYEASNLQGKNALVVTVPYYSFKKGKVLIESKLSYYMPGLYGQGLEIATDQIEKIKTKRDTATESQDSYNTITRDGTINFIEQVYRQTAKPYEYYIGLRNVEGTISTDKKISEKNVSGHAFVKTVILKTNIYFEKLDAIPKPKLSYNLAAGDGPNFRVNENYEVDLLNYEFAKAPIIEEANRKAHQNGSWKDFENSIDFKEKQLDELTANKYILGYAFQHSVNNWVKDLNVVLGGLGELPVYKFEDTYNKDKWSTLDPAIYVTIDISSIAASFVAADAIPEAIGLMYAIARKDGLNTGIYSTAILLPVIASGELRAGQGLARNLSKESAVFYRGFIYKLTPEGGLYKMPGDYAKARVLSFFNLTDKTVSSVEIDAFITAFKNNKFSNKQLKEVVSQADEVARASKLTEILAKTGGKVKILGKLGDNLPHAKSFINSLDDIADAKLLSRIENLSQTQLENLNTFYKNRPSPGGFTLADFNFTATKTINGQQVSISYKNGFPDFHNTPYCPSMTYANGVKGKFKIESNILKGSGTDFKLANESLLEKIGIQKGSAKNAEGFYQKKNYRWDGDSPQFEIKNVDGGWDKYTWHHVEDGKTMIPVLSKIHTGNQGGFVHPGGNAIIKGDIKDIFEFTGF